MLCLEQQDLYILYPYPWIDGVKIFIYQISAVTVRVLMANQSMDPHIQSQQMAHSLKLCAYVLLLFLVHSDSPVNESTTQFCIRASSSRHSAWPRSHYCCSKIPPDDTWSGGVWNWAHSGLFSYLLPEDDGTVRFMNQSTRQFMTIRCISIRSKAAFLDPGISSPSWEIGDIFIPHLIKNITRSDYVRPIPRPNQPGNFVTMSWF